MAKSGAAKPRDGHGLTEERLGTGVAACGRASEGGQADHSQPENAEGRTELLMCRGQRSGCGYKEEGEMAASKHLLW